MLRLAGTMFHRPAQSRPNVPSSRLEWVLCRIHALAVDVLAEYGPTLDRPLADTLTGSKIANLKELRLRRTMIRVLFVFDPWRVRHR